jgi:hypothetical protein
MTIPPDINRVREILSGLLMLLQDTGESDSDLNVISIGVGSLLEVIDRGKSDPSAFIQYGMMIMEFRRHFGYDVSPEDN